MNTDYIEEQTIKPGFLPSWLGSFMTDWLSPLALLGVVVVIILMANGVEMGDAGFIIFMSLIGLIVLGILFIRFGIGYKHRYTISRLKENGEYDMETPRKYTPLQYNWYQKFYTKFKKSRVLELFAFEEGNVYIATSDGVFLEKPLNDLTFTYTKEKRTNGEKVFTFVVKDIDGGQEVRFVKVPYLLEDAEWEDILNILSRSKFKRSKEEGSGEKAISAVLSILQGDIAEGIEGLGDAANNSFSMIEGMKLYNK